MHDTSLGKINHYVQYEIQKNSEKKYMDWTRISYFSLSEIGFAQMTLDQVLIRPQVNKSNYI